MTRSQHGAEKKAQQQKQPVEHTMCTSEPQYWYVMPIKDQDIVKNIVKWALETPVTVSTWELLSIALDMWRDVKESVITKQVLQTATTVFIKEEKPEDTAKVFMTGLVSQVNGLVVAKEVEELWALDVLINGHKLEALAGDGSQIVSIQKDLWGKISMPIRLDHVMVIELANKSKDKSMDGIIKESKDWHWQLWFLPAGTSGKGHALWNVIRATVSHLDAREMQGKWWGVGECVEVSDGIVDSSTR